MEQNIFIKKCKELVVTYNQALSNKYDKVITTEDVHVISYVKTLENSRAVMATSLLDGMRYEFTYNGSLNIIFFDAYKRSNSITIPVE